MLCDLVLVIFVQAEIITGMRITLVTVGKTDIGWVREGLQTYVSRIRRHAVFDVVEIPELKNVSSFSRDQIKVREGELIMKHLKPADHVILLDEKGVEFRSVEFASWLQDRMARGGRDLVFVIGGAYGFSAEVYERGDSRISLSKMTFSHQLVRTVFAEQLYRAFAILKGEPYHHE